MKIVSSRRFGLWTKLFKRWTRQQHEDTVASINAHADDVKEDILTAIEENAVESISESEINRLFTNSNEQR